MTASTELPQLIRSTAKLRLRLLLFSVALSAVAVAVFAVRGAAPIMGTRAAGVSASIAVLERGGPPLLGSDVPYHSGIAVSHLQPVGVTDDQGIYLYLPELARLTGERNPAVLMKWLFIGCFALLVLVYPFLFYELFGSVAVAIAAPILALGEFAFTEGSDLYWVLSWCMLLGIPGLVLAHQWWSAHRRRAVLLLTALMLMASFSTSIRIQAGLPIVIGAVGIALFAGSSWRQLRRFWKQRRWWVSPLIAAGLVVAYLSISTFGFAAVRAYRNHVIHQPSFGAAWPSQHPFWHNAYIGLGYLPNPYGIDYHDAVATDAVERARPDAGYLTNSYESTLEHEYAQIARHNPGFLLRNFWIKTRTIVSDAARRFFLAFLLLPVALLRGAQRRMMRVAVLVAIPAAVLGALAPILTVPLISYELGWLGTWGALLVFSFGWLWVAGRDAGIRLRAPRLGRRGHARDPAPAGWQALRTASTPLWAALGALALAVALIAFLRPTPASSGALYASQPLATADPALLDQPALRSWSFDRSLPGGWRRAEGAFVQPDGNGLYVRSPMTTTGTELSGPWLELPAGPYHLVTSARSLADGLQVGVREENGTMLAQSGYSWQQADLPAAELELSFVLHAPARVQPLLSSWSAIPTASASIVFEIKLLAAGHGGRG